MLARLLETFMATKKQTEIPDELVAHYEKLIALGKVKKVALVACMRRMLKILDAMVRTNRHWIDVTLAPVN